jgi:hypothetical protein
VDRPGKKTAAAIHQEIAREVNLLLQRVFAERHKTGNTDLEALEMALRASLHQAGAEVLTHLLQFAPPPAEQPPRPCPCGHSAAFRELRRKTIVTALGEVQWQRPYYLCRHCHHGQFPADTELDVVETELSPGVRRMLAVVGEAAPFDHGRLQIELLAGLKVNTKAVERTAEAIGEDIAQRQEEEIQPALQIDLPGVAEPPVPIMYVELDGTGIPVVHRETEGRAGKRDGVPAHTREAKLGCVFTQTRRDEEGRPVRDEASTTYVGAIEPAEQFGRRLYAEAIHRGWARAFLRAVLGDGAEWIWNLAELHFPDAIHIVDLYHARQHLWELAAQLYPNDAPKQKRWVMRKQNQLDQGRIESLVASLRSQADANPDSAEVLTTEAKYFERNKRRMRYPEFRKQGLFIGSGVIEAGCKTVGNRLKQSGMFWTVRGANAILALRCCRLSGKFEDYWEARTA